jgi:hypothetical protein
MPETNKGDGIATATIFGHSADAAPARRSASAVTLF